MKTFRLVRRELPNGEQRFFGEVERRVGPFSFGWSRHLSLSVWYDDSHFFREYNTVEEAEADINSAIVKLNERFNETMRNSNFVVIRKFFHGA